MVIINLLLINVIVTFIIDVSGFTDWLLNTLSAFLKRKVVSLKPVTCSLCSTWWLSLIYLLCIHKLTIPLIAFCAISATFTTVTAPLIMLVRDTFLKVIRKLIEHTL